MGAPRYLTSSDLGGLYSGGSAGTTDRAPRCQPRTALAQNLLGGGRARRPRGAGSSSEPPVLMRYEWWFAFVTLRLDAFLALLQRDSPRVWLACPGVAQPKVRQAEVERWLVRKRGLEPPLPCGNKLLRLSKIAADRSGPRTIEVRCPSPRPFVAPCGRVPRNFMQVLVRALD